MTFIGCINTVPAIGPGPEFLRNTASGRHHFGISLWPGQTYLVCRSVPRPPLWVFLCASLCLRLRLRLPVQQARCLLSTDGLPIWRRLLIGLWAGRRGGRSGVTRSQSSAGGDITPESRASTPARTSRTTSQSLCGRLVSESDDIDLRLVDKESGLSSLDFKQDSCDACSAMIELTPC